MKKLLLILCCLVNFYQCCTPTEKQQLMLNEVKEEFDDYCEIKFIPCTYDFIEVQLKTAEIPTRTSRLHQILYDQKERKGWFSIVVFDKEGKFFLEHTADGKRYYTAPQW